MSVSWASVDAPLVTFEDINRGLWPASIRIRSGNVFSYAFNNYWYTDSPAQQGGQFTFRYAVTSGPGLSAAEVTRFALEQRSELTAIRRYHKGWKQTLPEEGAGFLRASPGGVVVLTMRPLSERNNYLVRVHNALPEPVSATIEFPSIQLEGASRASILGERISPLDFSAHEIRLALEPYDLQSVVVRIRPATD